MIKLLDNSKFAPNFTRSYRQCQPLGNNVYYSCDSCRHA